jgi:hypothetical protein
VKKHNDENTFFVSRNPKGYSLPSGSEWPKNKRIPRLYYINKNQTILIILQGDITRTKVDAIVNGLFNT